MQTREERDSEYLAKPDPERIWLAPKCEGLSDEGRSWCDHPRDCEDCDLKSVEYIRADLAAVHAQDAGACEHCDFVAWRWRWGEKDFWKYTDLNGPGIPSTAYQVEPLYTDGGSSLRTPAEGDSPPYEDLRKTNVELMAKLRDARAQVEEARISFEAIYSFSDSEMRDGDAARDLAERWLKHSSTMREGGQ